MKHCTICGIDKPFNAEAKPGSKASGFYGRKCWSCFCVVNNAKSNAYYHANYEVLNSKPKTPERVAHYRTKSIARKFNIRQAKPLWADTQAIAAIYKLRDEVSLATGVQHVVDHIVPLRGKLVSGLHVESNLQIVPWSVNAEKSNQF